MAVSETQLRRRMKQFTETCRRRRLKITHQRTEVFRDLAATEEHPDAEAVYQRVRKRIPAISRDTVYRTLATLEAQGLICRAETYTGALRYDANTEPHHHFVCVECGCVQDFFSNTLNNLPIPRSVGALGTVESAHVQVRGICATCRRLKARKRRTH